MNRRKPRIIPVLDVLHGQVVRAVGGRRNEYRPLTSGLVPSTEPDAVAHALLKASAAQEIYVADLDSIQGRVSLAPEVSKVIEGLPVPVWLDGGFGLSHDFAELVAWPRVRPVVGFETCRSPEALQSLMAAVAASTRADEGGNTHRSVAFSIDMQNGRLLGDWRSWGLRDECDARSLARAVVRLGCRHVIVLDLARVGLGSGTGTDGLLRAIRSEFQQIELIAGGGVKTEADLARLGDCEVDAVLVASALHDGDL
jgi:phosphoribosylformimino-5-aminoimidazole carboxamide ribotide isomerase